jgi:hypothetical protein
MSEFVSNMQYEPKRQNRFMLEFPDELGLDSWMVNTASKPTYRKNRWDNMEITFKDPIGPSSSQQLFKLISFIEKVKEGLPSEQPLFIYKIISLDPTGVTVETWEIGVKDVISIKFGQKLDYASNEMVTPKIVIQPMYCILLP